MTSRENAVRSVCFAVLVGSTLWVFWASLTLLARFSFQHEHYSHIILVPLISALLVILERRGIFSHVETCWGAGLGVLFAGGLLYWLGHRYSFSAAIFSVVLIWIGSFVLCYGIRPLRTGLFPVLFLFLMVPIPDVPLDYVIVWLQTGSAEVSSALFGLAGVPVSRAGFVFSLPGVTIEIARECSGIRSSLALLIVSLLAGHLFLRSTWTKAVLILATLPLLIVKNGIRIVALTLLSVFAEPLIQTGNLHHQGGILFFLLALVLLAPVLRLLQHSEQSSAPPRDTLAASSR